MDKYLVIITTVLVITQVIRIIQNTISLHRNNVIFKRQVGELSEMEVKKEDFEVQREAYRLIVEKLTEEPCASKEFLEECKEVAKKYKKPMTNADRIRNFTDEELEEFLERIAYGCRGRKDSTYCEECMLFECPLCNETCIGKWLQAEVKEGAE